MPKAEPHFDSNALLRSVHDQDIGLHVTTNNPVGFRATVYKAMRAQPSLRIHIYAVPSRSNSFYLLKAELPNLPPADEPEDEA
jgi:hypothetical protein